MSTEVKNQTIVDVLSEKFKDIDKCVMKAISQGYKAHTNERGGSLKLHHYSSENKVRFHSTVEIDGENISLVHKVDGKVETSAKQKLSNAIVKQLIENDFDITEVFDLEAIEKQKETLKKLENVDQAALDKFLASQKK